jgi:glycosyltransferase involved in cell wall biosynthesis
VPLPFDVMCGAPMLIGINGLLLTGERGYRQTGVSRYIAELVAALPAALPDDDLLLYARRGEQIPPGVRLVPAPGRTVDPLARIVWETVALPVLTRRGRLDLFHGTVNTLPPFLPCPAIVTVHDLALLRWPEQVPRRRHAFLSRAIPRAVRQARWVIAVSEATKQDVVRTFGIPPERVLVTPLGVDARFRPAEPGRLAAFRERHGLSDPYLLWVGTLEPRKNLPRLLEAFAQLGSEIPHRLVLVGPEGWRTGELAATLERLALGDRVRFTGFVSNEVLPLWYAPADLFLFPSLYEGFGLPILEAMACGTPVVTSNVSSMPEVGGDAACYADPESADAIAAAIRRVLNDPELRATMRARGLERAAGFTWARTADLTAAAYRQALA